MKYYVIKNSDGDTYVEEIDKQELLNRLDPEDPYYGTLEFLKTIPKNGDTNYWGDKLLIIKGEIVVPKAIEVATKYEL